MIWQPISELNVKDRQMFVVKGFGIDVGGYGPHYNTDLYCVWMNDDGSFGRWPHAFQPTHFCMLPTLEK